MSKMPMIEFRPVIGENIGKVIRLSVAEEQKKYIMDNVTTIAYCYVFPTKIPKAVFIKDELVGLVCTELDPDTNRHEILVYMIDEKFQGRGYGKATLTALVDQMHQEQPDHDIYLNYVPGNGRAEKVYRDLGFEPTGELEGEEIVMCRPKLKE